MDFREAHHLPSRGRSDPNDLPRQRKGTTPQLHGRYPDYDVLGQADHWDPVTRELVVGRVEQEPPRRFFGHAEFACLRAFCDVVLAQDAEPRIPVMSFVDEKLHLGQLDGFQYVGMPDDRDTWRLVARGLDEAVGGDGFAAADDETRHRVVGAFSEGELSGGVWEELPAATAWSVVMRGVLSAFYAHPWAWNEIGFGGPAYPRGYMRLSEGPAGADPGEAREAFERDPVKDARRRSAA